MKFLKIRKDGGPDSNVTGYWLVEIKSLFSIVLLKFADGSRENYHSHAFNAWSWLLKGHLVEYHLDNKSNDIYPSWKIFKTSKSCFHRVRSFGDSWALTFRGPWSATWEEYNPNTQEIIGLTHGREEIYRIKNKS